MTNPTEPTPPQPGDDATATAATAPESVEPAAPEPAAPDAPAAPVAPQPADVQPTEAYPPADAQPTEVYPPADAQPTEVYPPAGQPVYGDPAAPSAYGQPAYGAPAAGGPAYGAPVAGPAAVSAADRPRGLAWASLGLAIGGLVLVGAAFIPLAWVSLVLALVGGLLLLVALVLGIVALASKKQGGKGLGIAAIAVSVLGGLLWIFALTAAFLWIGLAVAGSSSGSSDPEISVSEEATPGDEESTEEEVPAGVYDEEAYLAEVRPEITAILQEIDPNFTEDLIGQIYSDDMLVSTGQALLAAGDSARDAFVTSTVESSDGMFTEEQAIAFYDSVLDAAELYLVEE
ncbi:hypothetical protein [Microbacterium sp. Root180]|uniref:hypothetical protein n=1 Tax=Microbacterium sp. Root180 TaxID=1736483 RepID=UPI000701DDB5|nr:hypothetical protein [Microbacterium sp. Root180]KRB36479.1 hypothetical protein ASD93_10430 [Microbacterium sp. Root180]